MKDCAARAMETDSERAVTNLYAYIHSFATIRISVQSSFFRDYCHKRVTIMTPAKLLERLTASPSLGYCSAVEVNFPSPALGTFARSVP